MLLVALLWLVLCAAVGVFASSRGRDLAIWFGIALLISPLVALVIVAVIPEGHGQVPVAQTGLLGSAPASELLEALEKLFDRGALTPLEVQQLEILAARKLPAPPPKVVVKSGAEQFTRPCPTCGGMIHPQATTCLHCWSKLPRLAA